MAGGRLAGGRLDWGKLGGGRLAAAARGAGGKLAGGMLPGTMYWLLYPCRKKQFLVRILFFFLTLTANYFKNLVAIIRVARFGTKVGQLASNGTNQIKFQYILAMFRYIII